MPYEDDLTRNATIMREDRGLGTPAPPVVGTPPGSAQGDYAAGTPPGRNTGGLIPPELQSIIDKVTSSSSSISPRQRENMTHLAGVVGGLQQNRQTQQGEMARLGVTGAQQMANTNLTETGALARTNIATTPAFMEQKRKALVQPGSGQAAMDARDAQNTGGVGESVHDSWQADQWGIPKRKTIIDRSTNTISNYP